MNKDELRVEFSEKRPELYAVELFKERGFIRKKVQKVWQILLDTG